jgi:release factor glutamine methyltransferase
MQDGLRRTLRPLRRPASVSEALQWGRVALAEAGPIATESPSLDADVLLRHVLGWDRATLFGHDHEAISPPAWRRFRALVGRRVRAEPIAYLTGTREFAGLSFRVNRHVLIPRPDTETIVELGIARLAPLGSSGRAADVGTGSGAIAISLARACRSAIVHAIDIDPGAIRVARRNAWRLAAGARLRFHLGDGLPAAQARVDVVCANLPYVPDHAIPELNATVRDWEPHLALAGGPDGLDPYRALLNATPHHVRAGGSILMECDPVQAEALSSLARTAHPDARISVHRDLAGHDRVVEARLPGTEPTIRRRTGTTPLPSVAPATNRVTLRPP